MPAHTMQAWSVHGRASKGRCVVAVGRGHKRTVLALLRKQRRQGVSAVQGNSRANVARSCSGVERTSTALSKPICSFCAMPIQVTVHGQKQRDSIESGAGLWPWLTLTVKHNLVIHRRLDVALGATAQQSASLVRETVVQCLRGKWTRWVPSARTGSSSGRTAQGQNVASAEATRATVKIVCVV